jgi:dienelactone hydrolase
MRFIIVADIFGRTIELDRLVSVLSTDATKTRIVDPYGGAYPQFEDEQTAYTCFQDTVGLNGYEKILLEVVGQDDEKTVLIGFSVGAAVVWLVSNHKIFHQKTRAVCFYGSQIRHLLHVNPGIDMDLYFPKQEPHFDVQELIKRLSGKKRVTCTQTPFLHGFMNKKSDNFDEIGYQKYLQSLKDTLNPSLK